MKLGVGSAPAQLMSEHLSERVGDASAEKQSAEARKGKKKHPGSFASVPAAIGVHRMGFPLLLPLRNAAAATAADVAEEVAREQWETVASAPGRADWCGVQGAVRGDPRPRTVPEARGTRAAAAAAAAARAAGRSVTDRRAVRPDEETLATAPPAPPAWALLLKLPSGAGTPLARRAKRPAVAAGAPCEPPTAAPARRETM